MQNTYVQLRTKLPPLPSFTAPWFYIFCIKGLIFGFMLNTIVLLPSSANGQKKNTRCIMQSVVGANLSSEALIMGIKGFVSVHGKNDSRFFSITLFGYSAIRRSSSTKKNVAYLSAGVFWEIKIFELVSLSLLKSIQGAGRWPITKSSQYYMTKDDRKIFLYRLYALLTQISLY